MVSDEYPWPERSGYRLRLGGLLRALAGTATVDLLVVVLDPDSPRQPAPPDLPLGRCTVVAGAPLPGRRAGRLRRWLTGTLPRTLLWRDWAPARAVLREWADAGYDAVWFSHAPAFLALGDLVHVPRIVDLDNLDAFVLRHRRGRRPSGRLGSAVRAAGLLHRLADAVDQRRWHGLQVRIVDEADAVVVCSELDRQRLGVANAVVVPNAYDRRGDPLAPVGDRAGTGPTLLMVGLLTYEANRDAAGFFATQVLPRVRAARADATFRLVGRYDRPEQVAAVRDRPGVVVLGEVPDLRTELARADVVVVPVRYGGGTRIKILEAFAYGVPVVATTVGCEGLEVKPGEDLLVADEAAAFAAACLRLLGDRQLRSRIGARGQACWQRRYRWEAVAPTVRTIVSEVAARRG